VTVGCLWRDLVFQGRDVSSIADLIREA